MFSAAHRNPPVRGVLDSQRLGRSAMSRPTPLLEVDMFSIKAVVLAAGFLTGAAATQTVPTAAAAPPVKKGQNKNQKKKGNTKKADTLTALFKQLDTNNDGKLSSAEFAKLKDVKTANKKANGKAAKKNKKANPKKANKANKGNKKKGNKSDALFKQLDTNNDGSLSPAEFKKLTEVQQTAKKAKQAKKANKNKQ
jgi:hypothetical protein